MSVLDLLGGAFGTTHLFQQSSSYVSALCDRQAADAQQQMMRQRQYEALCNQGEMTISQARGMQNALAPPASDCAYCGRERHSRQSCEGCGAPP